MAENKPRAIDRVYEALHQNAKEGKRSVSVIVTCSFDMLLRKQHNRADAYLEFRPGCATLLGLPYVVIHDLPEDFKIGG